MEETVFEIKFLGETFSGFYVKNVETAEQILSKLMLKDCLFALDTETAALPKYKSNPQAALSPHLSQVRLLQIFDGKNSFIFDCYHVPILLFREFLQSKRFIAHNALFDLSFIRKAGIEGVEMGCTMLAWIILYHAISAEDEGFSAKLVDVTKNLLGSDILKHMQRSDWSVPELTYEQLLYAGVDAICVLKIAEKLSKGLNKHGLINYYNLCKKALHPISEIQLNGVKLDVEHHKEAVAKWRDELVVAKKEVLALTGLKDITSHTLAKWLGENLDPATLAIWPKTEKGKLKTDSHAFAEFSYLPIVEPFAAYQKKQTLCSTFGTNLFGFINAATGRLHPSYFLVGARTVRLSSRNPNGQNMPRDSTIRESFVAEPGNVLVVADYNQIELRLAAELSQDKVMLQAYKDGADLHRLTASRISGKNEVSEEERRKAKSFNFGIIFGMGKAKYVKMSKKEYKVDISEQVAKDHIDAWKDLYEGYTDWHQSVAKEAERTLTTSTPTGKHRRLEDGLTYSISANNPIQGGAAEVVLCALIRILDKIYFKPTGIKLVNTVHDEIVLECAKHQATFAARLLKQAMVEGYLDVFPNGITRDLVEVGAGPNWAAAKDKKNRIDFNETKCYTDNYEVTNQPAV